MFGESKRILALETQVERLEGKVKNLQLEWDDFYDKGAKILRRIGRDRAKLEEQAVPEPEQPSLPIPTNGSSGLLTDHQREMQQLILRRRAGIQ